MALPDGWVEDGNRIESGQAWVHPVRRCDGIQRFALKMLKNPKRAERFHRELETMRRLYDTGVAVVGVVESGEYKGRLWYAMPWTDEGNLEQLRLENVEDRVDVVASLYESLIRIHAEGVAHRDIKPANVLMFNGRPVWSDFGLCLETSDEAKRLTMTEEVVGPRWYLAPECEGGRTDVDARLSDRYSVAKLAWVVVSGQRVLPREQQSEREHRLGNLIDHRFAVLDDLLTRSIQLDFTRRPELTSVLAELRAVCLPDEPAKIGVRRLQEALARHDLSEAVEATATHEQASHEEANEFGSFVDELFAATERELRPVLEQFNTSSRLFAAFSRSNFIGDTLYQRFTWLPGWLSSCGAPSLAPAPSNAPGFTFLINYRGGGTTRANAQLVPIVVPAGGTIHVVAVPFIANPNPSNGGFTWESDEHLARYRRHWSFKTDTDGSVVRWARTIAIELGATCTEFATDFTAALAENPERVTLTTWPAPPQVASSDLPLPQALGIAPNETLPSSHA